MPPPQAANATDDDGQPNSTDFWVVQHNLTPFHAKCVDSPTGRRRAPVAREELCCGTRLSRILEIEQGLDEGTQASIRCLGRKRFGETHPSRVAARDHIRERKKEEEENEEGRWWHWHFSLTRVVVVHFVVGSRQAPLAESESCMLTIRTKHGEGLRPLEKGTNIYFGKTHRWS